MFSFSEAGCCVQQEYWDNGRVASLDYTQLQENAARDTTGSSGSVDVSGAIFALRWSHPERSRFSGGAKDLPLRHRVQRETLRPLVKTRALRDESS